MTMRAKNVKQSAAFTLVELLASLAIVSLIMVACVGVMVLAARSQGRSAPPPRRRPMAMG